MSHFPAPTCINPLFKLPAEQSHTRANHLLNSLSNSSIPLLEETIYSAPLQKELTHMGSDLKGSYLCLHGSIHFQYHMRSNSSTPLLEDTIYLAPPQQEQKHMGSDLKGSYLCLHGSIHFQYHIFSPLNWSKSVQPLKRWGYPCYSSIYLALKGN